MFKDMIQNVNIPTSGVPEQGNRKPYFSPTPNLSESNEQSLKERLKNALISGGDIIWGPDLDEVKQEEVK